MYRACIDRAIHLINPKNSLLAFTVYRLQGVSHFMSVVTGTMSVVTGTVSVVTGTFFRTLIYQGFQPPQPLLKKLKEIKQPAGFRCRYTR